MSKTRFGRPCSWNSKFSTISSLLPATHWLFTWLYSTATTEKWRRQRFHVPGVRAEADTENCIYPVHRFSTDNQLSLFYLNRIPLLWFPLANKTAISLRFSWVPFITCRGNTVWYQREYTTIGKFWESRDITGDKTARRSGWGDWEREKDMKMSSFQCPLSSLSCIRTFTWLLSSQEAWGVVIAVFYSHLQNRGSGGFEGQQNVNQDQDLSSLSQEV